MHILKKWLRQGFSLSLLTVLLACTTTSERAAERYQRGDYVGAIREVTYKLDEKKSYPRSSLKKEWLETIHSSIQNIENMPIATLDQKIIRLETVLKARLLTNSGFYSDEFAHFNRYYPMDELKLTIAKLYYEKGTTNQGKTTSDYLYRVEAFAKGLEYAPYKDMEALLKSNRFEYSKSLASDYYVEGQRYVKEKDYERASTAFEKAQSAYSNYGQYKDASELAKKYEKIWRTNAAEVQLIQANKRMEQARTKADYRNAAQEFKKVIDIYSQYGDYKNSRTAYNSARQKGRLNVAYTLDKVRGSNSCGTFSRDDLDKRLEALITKRFSTYPYAIVSSKASADFIIDISYRNNFEEGKLNKKQQKQSWVDDAGKEHAYVHNSETQENTFDMRIDIETRGDLHSTDSEKFSSSSSYEKHSYTGDVPSNVRNSSKGTTRNNQELCSDTLSDVERKVGNILSDIERKSRRL